MGSEGKSWMGDGHHKATSDDLQLAYVSRQSLSWVSGKVTSRTLCFCKSLHSSDKRWWLRVFSAMCALEGTLSAPDRHKVRSAVLGGLLTASQRPVTA